MGCGGTHEEEVAAVESTATGMPLFTSLSFQETGLTFANVLKGEDQMPISHYVNYFNGGGVAIGDLDNDGLPEVYLTGNSVPNKLFKNLGNMRFLDVSKKANVESADGWCTGVTMADVNADGFLDIYVCRSYNQDPALRKNELFINQQDGTFSEEAEQYGLADAGNGTQATFFDMDNDGDLDCYLANHPTNNPAASADRYPLFRSPSLEESDQLFRNEGNGTFTNITEEAGVLNWAFTLGVVAVDLNRDGLQDIYVANDHAEPDFIYENNGDGTFTDIGQQALRHMSNFSMGVDAADINNDGYPDVMVLDMMGDDNYRQKTNMASMSPETFWEYVDEGYHYQYMRNVLHLNNGNGTFSEIGQYSGVDKTDWSWAALFADFDNDGQRDLFVSNGYKLDYRNKDFLHDVEEVLAEHDAHGEELPPEQMYAMIPQTPLKNYLFMNQGDMKFQNRSFEAGIAIPSFSNGAAYGDLDNDGDLDLVVNNLIDAPFLFQNNTNDASDYLRIKLEGPANNPQGLGAKVTVRTTEEQFADHTLTRGFQSSVDPVMHFGLGEAGVAHIQITWPDGKWQEIGPVDANQLVTLSYSNADIQDIEHQSPAPLFVAATQTFGIKFKHFENEYDDYEKEVLLPHQMSRFGPALAVGDVNGDGMDDFYIGGAFGQAGVLNVQQEHPSFTFSQTLDDGKFYEDLGAAFFDADGDGDQDLYVVSGGSEYEPGSNRYQDRLYLNTDGKLKRSDAIPAMTASGSCVVPGDYDGDGDLDLFVGGRVLPGKYPSPAASTILQNNGGQFTNVTHEVAPLLQNLGMVTSAVWTDFNSDGKQDLIVVGEWMPITFLKNNGHSFADVSKEINLGPNVGWWNRIHKADLDNDGKEDLVVGNLGLNYKYLASPEEPTHIYAYDFDRSGSLDIVLGYYNDGTCYPVRGRQCSSEQMPNIKEKFPTYHAFGQATLEDIYGTDLKDAIHYAADNFASVVLMNTGSGFSMKSLPAPAQLSPVTGIVSRDVNNDGAIDLVLSGNLYVSEVETGRADAGIGVVLLGDGKGNWDHVPVVESGYYTPGDVKDIRLIELSDGGYAIAVANNDGMLQIIRREGSSGKVPM
jgi:hypothetical protein